MISFKIATNEDKELLYNLLQKYLYEMTNFYDDDIDDKGNYSYKYFEEYFIDKTRKAIFIINDENIVGFVLLNKYSYLDGTPDNVISEFLILPKFRKKHLAREAVKLLFEQYSGSWEIKYNNQNIPASQLWIQVTKPYYPHIHSLDEDETVLSFSTIINKISYKND